ncbi:MAG: threonylcarbamoyl-AMP synthase [Chlamydiae bacterium]|nr:threonylcarbamoyl-AMP synthase [Chlamydiota bacterium]MBI3276272.1 threonylcarbamoyl-AMP synthase [Chlamydiota bacterium]
MGLFPPTPFFIEQAASLIKKGGLVAFPTETVYGLGANALDPIAVAKIFEVKGRPHFDPLIIHILDISFLDFLCQNVPDQARILAQKFWPGPLTLVLPKKKIIPDLVTSGLQTVAIRIPSHPIALELIRISGVPIAAPSANPFKYLSPTTAEHVLNQLGNKVDMILEGGPCSIGLESTVMDLSNDEPCILRPGGLALEEIESVIGPLKTHFPPKKKGSLNSPGQLERHYSPRTPLKILEEGEFPKGNFGKIGLLAFKTISRKWNAVKIEILSPQGDLKEAAAHLFSSLHRLDEAGLDIIYAEPVPEIGLGIAIMNRLRKAEMKIQKSNIKNQNDKSKFKMPPL